MRDLKNIPPEMGVRPIDHRGFPVPWFVTEKHEDGRWNFNVVTSERVSQAITKRLCWVSGEPLGSFGSFVIGPMCVVNRVAADPPARKFIAEWSAQVCPFLSRPLAKRPEVPDVHDTPGHMVTDNPGMCAVWTTKTWTRDRHGLIRMGEPHSVTWWREGRRATQEEIDTIFAERVEKLLEIAAQDGPDAVNLCRAHIKMSEKWRKAA